MSLKQSPWYHALSVVTCDGDLRRERIDGGRQRSGRRWERRHREYVNDLQDNGSQACL